MTEYKRKFCKFTCFADNGLQSAVLRQTLQDVLRMLMIEAATASGKSLKQNSLTEKIVQQAGFFITIDALLGR
ncbi:MAG: hypothetical protein EOO69_02905 [Moraxellaceae bacterium]|nr:MAG: hypothetical protein EOO69_02905 [Moraxellaceae bacterium]